MYICYYPTCSFHDLHLNGTSRCTCTSKVASPCLIVLRTLDTAA